LRGLVSADAELARRCTRTAVGFLVLGLAVGLFAFLTPADRMIGPGR